MRTIKATKLNKGFGAEYVRAYLEIHPLKDEPVGAPAMTPEEAMKLDKGFGAEYVKAYQELHRRDNR